MAPSSLRDVDSPEPSMRRGTVANLQQQHRSNDSPARRARNAKAFSHYLGYPVEFLAEMIAPKSEMCNQRFELVVDDLAFVGHPVYQRAREPDQHPKDEAGRGRPPRSHDGGTPQDSSGSSGTTPPTSASASATPPAPPVEMLHLVLVIQPPDPSYATPTLDLTTWLGLWYDNVTFKMTAALWAEEQRCGYVSQQVALLSRLWGAVEGGTAGGGASPSYAHHLSDVLLTSSLARSLRQMFRSLTRPTTHRSAPFVVLNDSLEVHLQLPPLLTDPARMVKSILEIGPSIEADDPDVWADDAVGNPLDEWTRATGPPLFPWKTLLLLHEQEGERDAREKARRYRSIGGEVVEVDDEASEVSEQVSARDAMEQQGDAGIEVWSRKFTSHLVPTNLTGIPTFAQLAGLLDWDLQRDVYPMARHLVYYKQAKVTDVPRIQNTYAVSPLFDMEGDLPRFALSFGLRFPDQPPLIRLLAVLGASLQPFIQHWTSLQPNPIKQGEASSRSVNAQARERRCLSVLIWLLRHDVLLQQHLRFRLIATESVKRKAKEMHEQRRLERDEARRRREERREWKRERKALKRGVDPRRREGALVPLVAQSAPDGPGDGAAAAAAAAAANVRARAPWISQGAVDEQGRGRQRRRSRSAEARHRQEQQPGQPQPDGDNHARRAASRISSHSRSRSRNPPPLGRIAASGHLLRTSGSSSRPGSSSGLRVEASHPEVADTLQFHRRHVSRSRSPNSAAVELPIVSSADGGASDEAVASVAAAVAASSTSAAGSKGSGGGLSVASTQSGGVQASSSREKANQILAAEHHQVGQHRRGPSLASSGTSPSQGSSAPQATDHPLIASSSGATRGRRRRGDSGATSDGSTRAGRSATISHFEAAKPSPSFALRTFSRSPSQARMRVSGFGGEDEKVWVDGLEVTAETEVAKTLSSAVARAEGQEPAQDALDHDKEAGEGIGAAAGNEESGDDEATAPPRRLSLVGEESPQPPSPLEGSGDEAAKPVEQVSAALASPTQPAQPTPTLDLDEDSSEDDSNGYTSSSSSSSSSSTDPRNWDIHRPSLISDPSRASRVENAWIDAMLSLHAGASPPARTVSPSGDDDGGSSDDEDEDDEMGEATRQSFFRLLPYLNGRHTIDEVVCREGISRREVRKLLRRFSEEVLTFVHP